MNTTKRIALGAMLGSFITVQQVIFAVIPNVSLTGFLVVMFAIKLDRKTNLYVIITYLVSRNLYFGSPLQIWALYIIVFGGVSILISMTKRVTGNLYWAVFFGLLFGPLIGVVSAYTYYFLGGMEGHAIVPYLIRGIPFDIIHSASNAIIVVVLYDPVYKALDRLLESYE